MPSPCLAVVPPSSAMLYEMASHSLLSRGFGDSSTSWAVWDYREEGTEAGDSDGSGNLGADNVEVSVRLGAANTPRQITLSEVLLIPRINGRRLSMGSSWHASSTCMPCKHSGTSRGCRDGALCLDCHYPHLEVTQSEKRRRIFRRGKARAELSAMLSKLPNPASSSEACGLMGRIAGPQPEALPQPQFLRKQQSMPTWHPVPKPADAINRLLPICKAEVRVPPATGKEDGDGLPVQPTASSSSSAAMGAVTVLLL